MSAATRVLVIDDEPGLREMLSFGLPKRGFEVTCAANGEEGLMKARQARFDVVVCDIRMPGMGGVDVLKQLKEASPETQVVMATGFATLETAIDSMKNGAFDYITKPYGLPQLCSILEKAVEWRRLQARVDHLEELHRLKDEFIATVSHELRTPITVILGYAAVLRETVRDEAERRKGLQVIEAKAKGLLQIINNIIDLANINAKREPLILETFSLQEVAAEVVNAFRPVADARKLVFTLKAEADLFLETDRTKVKQILTHLIDNAIKFTSEGEVSVQLEPANDHRVRLIVRDTGIGIKEQDVPIIYQDFRQIDQSNTRRYGGTGLGLAVCRRLVQLLEGSLSVDSKPGQGSTFTILLPGRRFAMKPADPAAPAEAGPAPSDKHPRLLLVADDDPAFTRLFQNLLAREGYTVSIAGGGKEALDKMTQRKPDAILLDLMMPEMTGFDVIDAMLNNPLLKDVKVIVMTSKELTQAERSKVMARSELIIQKGSKDLPEILALLNQRLRRASSR